MYFAGFLYRLMRLEISFVVMFCSLNSSLKCSSVLMPWLGLAVIVQDFVFGFMQNFIAEFCSFVMQNFGFVQMDMGMIG